METLNDCLPDEIEEIALLYKIGQAMCKKHKREIVISYDDNLSNWSYTSAIAIASESPFQIVKNNTPITRNHFFKDQEFKKKLKAGTIQDHIPENVHNLLLSAGMSGNGMFKKLLASTGYEVLETLAESVYHKEGVSKLFIKLTEEKVEFYA